MGDDLFGKLAWVSARQLGKGHRKVGRKVAMGLILGVIDLDAWLQLSGQSTVLFQLFD